MSAEIPVVDTHGSISPWDAKSGCVPQYVAVPDRTDAGRWRPLT